MIAAYVVLAVLALLALAAVVSYNRFVRQRNLVAESWRQVDVELQRRHDLIPNLVDTVKAYAAHERAVFDDVARLRAAAVHPGSAPDEQAHQEDALTAALGRLFAVAEGYPDLKAGANFLALQRQLVETEDRIAAARRFYNGNVRALNIRVGAFPSSVMATAMDIGQAQYFEMDEAARSVPAVRS